MIYSYWEDYFRQEIATENYKEKNDITSDVMGDLRYLRESIIHHRGIAIEKIEKTNILKWFKKDQEINITEEQFETMIDNIKKDVEKLKTKS